MLKAQPGDIVQLKTGGPLMTVGSSVGDMHYCNFFDNDSLRTLTFDLRQLKVIERDGKKIS